MPSPLSGRASELGARIIKSSAIDAAPLIQFRTLSFVYRLSQWAFIRRADEGGDHHHFLVPGSKWVAAVLFASIFVLSLGNGAAAEEALAEEDRQAMTSCDSATTRFRQICLLGVQALGLTARRDFG